MVQHSACRKTTDVQENIEREARHIAAFLGDCGNDECAPCKRNRLMNQALFESLELEDADPISESELRVLDGNR